MLIKNNDNKKILYSEYQFRYIAKKLRYQNTLAEQILWKYLKNRQVKCAKFRRQHSLYGCIVDFYCYQYHLVVEVDGPIHLQQVVHDKQRDDKLIQHSNVVLRFTNEQVLNNINDVIYNISKHLEHPSPE